jgi:regulator of RNase E activity RraA
MRFKLILTIAILFSLNVANSIDAQTIPKEELMFLTSAWKGERFPDGRPKVSDDLVERAENIAIDDAWTVLKNNGYLNQFEGGWKMVKDDIPVIGRALTAMFVPSRPDLHENIMKRGASEGRKGNTNAWPIEVLTTGDVYVVDGFGKINGGTLMGGTLANSIFSKSGNGVVFNGSARDLKALEDLEGFNAFVRDFHPSFLEEMVLMGLNTPIRIGSAVVLPGDLVMANREGVLFIPAHMVELVVTTSEFVTLKDQFGFEMVKSGTYTTGQIDSQWTDDIRNDFMKWLEANPDEVKLTREQVDEFMKDRTW